MLAPKRPRLHRRAGTLYYWSLAGLCLTSATVAVMRWHDDAYLFGLGGLALGIATLGRLARRKLWKDWLPLHAAGMGGSYTVVLTAFYMDNGKSLPVWKNFPPEAYWAIPLTAGSLLIARALWRRRAEWSMRRS
jgi:hypothetical protein